MTLPSFGIPDEQSKLQALHQLAQANSELLQHVATSAITPAVSTLSSNDGLLNNVGSRLRNYLRGKIGANTRGLNQVVDQLHGYLRGVEASNTVALGAATGANPWTPNTRSGGGGEAVVSDKWMLAEYPWPNTANICYECVPPGAQPSYPNYIFGGYYDTEAACRNAGNTYQFNVCQGGAPQQPPQPIPPPPPPITNLPPPPTTPPPRVPQPTPLPPPPTSPPPTRRKSTTCIPPDQIDYTTAPPLPPGAQCGAMLWINGTRCECCFGPANGDLPPVFPPWNLNSDVVTGPFACAGDDAHRAAVIAWIGGYGYTDICPAGSQPPPVTPPPTSPPPTTPPPTTTPPIDTTPPTCPQCGCVTCNCAAPTTTPPTPPTPESQAYAEGDTLPNVSPTTLELPSVLDCGLLADGTLPAVGSVEFCSCLESFKRLFIDIGQQAVSILFPSGQQGQSDTSSLISSLIGSLVPGTDILSSLLGFTNSISSTISDQITNLWGMIGQIMVGSSSCSPIELVGMSLARALIRALKDIKIGLSWPAEITIRIDVVFESIEKVIWYCQNSACPVEIPGVNESIECYLRHTAPEMQVRCWLAMRGVNLDVWAPVIDARREQLLTHELIEWGRRIGMDDLQIIKLLTDRGWLRPEEAAARVTLYDHLPTIADHLHWLQRNVFDDQYVQDYGLLEGFEDRFWAKFGDDLHALGMQEQYAALHYAAHWINPAPGQLLEMVYRLRPDKPGVENPFTATDYQRILAEMDVAPYFRGRFNEIRYKIPALGYLRDMFRAYQLSDEEMASYHQDLGYSPTDSDRFVAIDRLQRTRMRASQTHGWDAAAIARAFSVGVLSDSDVRSKMDTLGYTDDEATNLMDRAQADLQHTVISRARSRVVFSVLSQVKSALSTGVIDTNTAAQSLVSMGWPQEFATGWATLQNTDAQVKLVKQAQGKIRGAYLRGEIDENYVRTALTQLAVVPTAIDTLVSTWQLEQTPNRKRRTANQIVTDVSQGALAVPDAIARLSTLGYEDPDIVLYLADARQKQLQREAQARRAQARQTASNAREIDRLRRASEKQARDLLAALKRVSPVPKLQKWAKLGLISEQLFWERMRTFGYPDTDIGRYWDEACSAKGAKCTQAPTVVETPPTNLQGSGFPG